MNSISQYIVVLAVFAFALLGCNTESTQPEENIDDELGSVVGKELTNPTQIQEKHVISPPAYVQVSNNENYWSTSELVGDDNIVHNLAHGMHGTAINSSDTFMWFNNTDLRISDNDFWFMSYEYRRDQIHYFRGVKIIDPVTGKYILSGYIVHEYGSEERSEMIQLIFRKK
jgi:hypothetical protein